MTSRWDRFVHEYDEPDMLPALFDPNHNLVVHESTNPRAGQTRYAVGEYDEDRGQYTCPMTSEERRLTGCHTYIGKRPSDLTSYTTRDKALRHARQQFDPIDRQKNGS